MLIALLPALCNDKNWRYRILKLYIAKVMAYAIKLMSSFKGLSRLLCATYMILLWTTFQIQYISTLARPYLGRDNMSFRSHQQKRQDSPSGYLQSSSDCSFIKIWNGLDGSWSECWFCLSERAWKESKLKIVHANISSCWNRHRAVFDFELKITAQCCFRSEEDPVC